MGLVKLRGAISDPSQAPLTFSAKIPIDQRSVWRLPLDGLVKPVNVSGAQDAQANAARIAAPEPSRCSTRRGHPAYWRAGG